MRLVRQYAAGAQLLDANGSLRRLPIAMDVWYDPPQLGAVPCPCARAAAITAGSTMPACDAYCLVSRAQPSQHPVAPSVPPGPPDAPCAGTHISGLSMVFDAQLAGRRGFTALVDSGATHVFVSPHVVHQLRLLTHKSPISTVGLADAKTSPVLGMVWLPLRIGKYFDTVLAHVLPDMMPSVQVIRRILAPASRGPRLVGDQGLPATQGSHSPRLLGDTAPSRAGTS